MKRCVNCFQEHDEHYDVCPFCGHHKGQPPKELYHLFPETVLAGRYSIGQVLGFGGFGITYKAWDMKLETIVAIKEYYPSGLVNRIPGQNEVILFAGNKVKEFNYGLSRFLDEARNTAKFSGHKNIVNVFEYFEENSTAYFVMEYLDGISLSGYLKENTMDIESCLSTIDCVASALKELHANGVVHRDVSPDNIFLCLNGNVKLIDFGAARFSASEERPMTIVLKPGFAPPEQYERISAQGPWTDIYALGATLYLMLTGTKPEESTDRKTQDTLLPPHEINPEITENISNAIMKAMALERHLRFTNVEDFEKALSGARKVTTLAKEKKYRKRKRLVGILLATLTVVITSGILGIRFMEQKDAETLPEANICVMYEITGENISDQAKANALMAIAEEFMNSYPDVTIELTGVESSEYLSKVNGFGSNQGESTLAIFESDSLDAETLDGLAIDMKDVLSSENAKLCYFLDSYDKYYASSKQLPIGFSAPVIYCNNTISPYSDTSVSDFAVMLENLGDSMGVAVNESSIESFTAAFGDDAINNAKVQIVEDSDGFVSGEFAFYVSSSEEYMDIQSKLPARYSIIAFATEMVQAEFSDLYSVTEGLTKDQKKVAIAFLNYLLSDNAQDYYFIQNWTGRLPLNSGALHVVEDVYSDFSGFFANISEYSFEVEQ